MREAERREEKIVNKSWEKMSLKNGGGWGNFYVEWNNDTGKVKESSGMEGGKKFNTLGKFLKMEK